MALTHEPDHRTGNRSLSSLAADEKGQVLPLLLMVIIGLLGAGMLVFWLGFSTSVATDAQTAADAAALGAEQSVDTQWNQLININGVLEPRDSYDDGEVQTEARKWASNNDATVTSVEYCDQSSGSCSPQPIYTSEPDVLVQVGTAAGIEEGEIRTMLESDRYVAEVRADELDARNLGCTGVPFFVIDRAFAIPGAQDVDTFLLTLQRAWDRSHPTVVETVSPDGAACTDDECVI